jgi:thiol-disulfide isomerase/thioredoxin
LPEKKKEELAIFLEGTVRLNIGSDPKLYGKMLDNKDFDWESLRGKHVLINFTGTWCGPCREKIPLMLEAYKKYHDKGFEIVQVYIGERTADPVAAVKNFVEEKQLPWMIISEALSEKANFTPHKLFYHTPTVPVMVLVDKRGAVIVPNESSNESGLWLAKLREIFE